LAKEIESTIPVLSGKVSRQKRQLGNRDKEVLTISALRGSVVCFAQGIIGVQHQTRPIDINDDLFAKLRV